MQHDLKWNEHVIDGKNSIIKQLQTRLSVLKKIVNSANIDFSINIANAIFMSKLIYGIQVWGFCPKYLIQKLQILQNKAARLVLGNKSLKYNNTKLMKEVKWLPVDKLVTLHMSKLCHQILNTVSPKYLYE